MSDMERRSKMSEVRRKQRHIAEERSMEFRALKAENARLRAALEDVVQRLGTGRSGAEALDIARGALDPQP